LAPAQVDDLRHAHTVARQVGRTGLLPPDGGVGRRPGGPLISSRPPGDARRTAVWSPTA
jgi:hypothetical protein